MTIHDQTQTTRPRMAQDKLFKSYIEMELQLGNIGRCRTLYTKYLEWSPANAGAWGRCARGGCVAQGEAGCGAGGWYALCARGEYGGVLGVSGAPAMPGAAPRRRPDRVWRVHMHRHPSLVQTQCCALPHCDTCAPTPPTSPHPHTHTHPSAPTQPGMLTWSGRWARPSGRAPYTSWPLRSRCWTCRSSSGRWVCTRGFF